MNGTPAVAAVSRGYAVAADSTGRTYSSSPVVPVWTGIERLAAGENAVLGLTHEGDVLAHPFGRHNTVDFVFTQPVAAIAAGPNHYAFLLDDGVLEIRRSNGESERYPLN